MIALQGQRNNYNNDIIITDTNLIHRAHVLVINAKLIMTEAVETYSMYRATIITTAVYNYKYG